MKKLVITLACMLTLGAIQAQEVEKENKFFMEAKVGMETFNNYSAISVFADEVANYSGTTTELNFGYRLPKNAAIELSLFSGGINSSYVAINEYFYNTEATIGFRKHFAITEKSEFYCGLRIGMTRCQNTLTYQNEDYKIIRYGIKTQLVTGYNYYITSRNYIGISLVFPSFGLFNSNGDIPTELSNFPVNQKTGLQGYSVNIGFGAKF